MRGINLFLSVYLLGHVSCLESVWRWECQQGLCQKLPITNDTQQTPLSLATCRLFCSEDAGIWPKPTGSVYLGNFAVPVNPDAIDIIQPDGKSPSVGLLKAAAALFKGDVIEKVPKREGRRKTNLGNELKVFMNIEDRLTDSLTLDTDESYSLIVEETDGVNVNITAKNFFGGRHALETLGQLIVYDDVNHNLMIPRDINITDKPAYPYRGILLDTARNFITKEHIKRTINGIRASKLNTLHWHMVDSQSFPYVSKSHPELAQYGAYSLHKTYSSKDVAEIVEYAKVRGVRVLPEFDAPAHVGEGWQNTDFLVCFKNQPWSSFCVEPPCGQFNPTKSGLYDVLEDLYRDIFTQFNPDIFHMGGDEVHFGCWNSSDDIVNWMAQQGWGRQESDFVKLWDHFQSSALDRVYKVAGKQLPIIMWTSTLTKKEYVNYLPKDKYIIQVWTTGDDPQVKDLLENGHKLILSNYDALYLDCGFAGWVTDGNNWCSPYKGWQKVYDNSPAKIAGDKKDQVLGAEATLWTEQVDSTSVDSRLWPRAAAMAETLWSAPNTTWKDAEERLLIHRERLVARGINADALEPEWCLQNEGQCPI